MKAQKFVVLFFVTLLLDLTVVHPVPVFASQTNTKNTHQSVAASFSDLSPTSLVTLLTAVEKLPQDMLARSDQAEIARFILEHGVNLKFTGERVKRGLGWYITSISWAIGTAAVGVLKLAKIKKFVNAVGGVQRAAKVLIAIAKGKNSSLAIACLLPLHLLPAGSRPNSLKCIAKIIHLCYSENGYNNILLNTERSFKNATKKIHNHKSTSNYFGTYSNTDYTNHTSFNL